MLTRADVAGEMGRVTRWRKRDTRHTPNPISRKYLQGGYVPGCHYTWLKPEKRYTTRVGYHSQTTGRHPAHHYLWQFAFVYESDESDVMARDIQKLFANDCPARLRTPYRRLPGRWYVPAARQSWRQSVDTIRGWKRLQGWHRAVYPAENFADHNIITYLQKDNVLMVVAYGDRFLRRDRQWGSGIITANKLLIQLTSKLDTP